MDIEVAERAVEGFFRASEEGDFVGAGAFLADDATLWTNLDPQQRSFYDSLPRLAKMYRNVGPWAYSDVRRVVGDDAVCEQHTVTFTPSGRGEVVADVCVVARVDSNGLITRLEEYLDSGAVAALSIR